MKKTTDRQMKIEEAKWMVKSNKESVRKILDDVAASMERKLELVRQQISALDAEESSRRSTEFATTQRVQHELVWFIANTETELANALQYSLAVATFQAQLKDLTEEAR